jgi:hypothetical protein
MSVSAFPNHVTSPETKTSPPIGPLNRTIHKGLCWAGITPCLKPARLFCSGWRCPDHPPNIRAARAHLTVVAG